MILDVRLPDMSGLEAYALIRQIDARLPVIVITAHGTTETAIEAMKLGAFEYLLKPLDLAQLRDVVARAIHLSQISRVPAMYDEKQEPQAEGDQLVGSSPPMQELYKSIGRIAPQDVTVLILGESGTGKELVARAIYQHSRRSQAPFLAINCAAIPESLLESELFGHERGASPAPIGGASASSSRPTAARSSWTRSATWRRPPRPSCCGCCRSSSSSGWAATATIRTDVRVIAATNQDLRIAGRRRPVPPGPLLPPERADDPHPALARADRRHAPAGRVLPRPHEPRIGPPRPSASRRRPCNCLKRHSWPGNVRELQSAIKYALVQPRGDVLTADCLPPSLRELPAAAGRTGGEPATLDLVAGLCRNSWRRTAGTSITASRPPSIGSCWTRCWSTSRGTRSRPPKSSASPETPCAPNSALGLVVEKQVNVQKTPRPRAGK